MSTINVTEQQPSKSKYRPVSDQFIYQSGINDALAWALIGLMALVPLPFGSVHAFSWGFFALYVGVVGVFYVAKIASLGEPLRVPLSRLRLQTLTFGLMLAYLVIQIIPFGSLLGPLGFLPVTGQAIAVDTISIAPDSTLLMLMRQLTYGMVFFLTLQVAHSDARRHLLHKAILAVIVFYGVWAIVSLNTGDTVVGIPKSSYQGSATGTFVNRNSFATFLAFGCVVTLALAGRCIVDQVDRHPNDGVIAGNSSRITIYSFAYLLLLAITFATQSRMGVLVALAGSAVVALVVISRAIRSRITLLSVLVVGSVAIAGSVLLFGNNLFDRLFDLDRSSGIRTDLYAQILDLIALRLWTGYGGGAFELAFPLVHNAPVSLDYLWDRGHNTYLTLWSELGLIAGSLPMIMLLVAGVSLVRALVAGRGSWVAQTIALAALVLSAVHSLVDFSLEIQANTIVFVMLIAIGLATSFRATQR